MYETEVELEGDSIRISQPDFGDGADSILLSIEQVDILIEWLREAKEEWEEKRSRLYHHAQPTEADMVSRK